MTNPANLSHEEILALRAQAGKAPIEASASVPASGAWGTAPRIGQVTKVTVPQIRNSEGENITEAGQEKIRGPRPEFLAQQEKLRAKEALERLEREQQLREEREAMKPDKLLARVSYLERQVKQLAAALKKVTKEE